MTRPTKEPCGCTHDGARWLSECSAHKAENDALHLRALAEHRGERSTPNVWGTRRDIQGNPTVEPYVPLADVDWLDLPGIPSPQGTESP